MTVRTIFTVALIAIATLAGSLIHPSPALASMSGELSMEILVDGKPLREYPARGTTYVEARPDAEYSIRLHNRTARRVAVALAVDGLNSIDARTSTAAKASKWVIDPYQSITIEGWQTNRKEARRFFFTTEDNSYGDWLGKTTNLGVIEAVVFRERRQPQEFADSTVSRRSRREQSAGAPAPVPSSKGVGDRDAASKSQPEDLAATGIGRRLDHPVRRVHLDLEPQPSANLRIRYEYRPQLVALGVLPLASLPNPLDRREQARGFEDSGFCPDPFGAH